MKIFKGLPEGYYGNYGGRYVPELLIPVLDELGDCFNSVKNDEAFFNEYYNLLKEFCGRETPLTYAKNLTEYFGKGKIFIKREDLNHSGAHKINNVMGQAMIMKKLGKKRVIAETGAGQHGVATAVMAAKMGFDATIYMGAEDVASLAGNRGHLPPCESLHQPSMGIHHLPDHSVLAGEVLVEYPLQTGPSHYLALEGAGAVREPDIANQVTERLTH